MGEEECALHQAALTAVGNPQFGFEQDPDNLIGFQGAADCPPGEACPICDLARAYRASMYRLTHGEENPEGQHPPELWKRLVERVRFT